MSLACKICIVKTGIKFGTDKGKKIFETEEELYNHLENYHGRPVIRENETEQQAIERCAKKGIVEDRNICQCEECKKLRGENLKV